MRSKLLKSFIYVFGFWWTLFALWWSLANPAINLESIVRLHRFLPFLPLAFPEGPVNVLDAWSIQKQVILYWSAPLAVLSAVSAAIGTACVWLFTWFQHKERDAREVSRGGFRGASVTLGELSAPTPTKRDTLELGAADSEIFACMSKEEKAVLVDILGILSAHPDAFPGSGIGVSLLEHTVRVVEEALSSKHRPGLSAIVAAAHETGKISAYVNAGEGEWTRVKSHDREAARHLATLDSWWALPSDVRMAVLFAVKYKTSPALLPEVDENPHIHKLAKDLLYRAAETTEKVATVAQARVLEKQELPAVALKGFLDALPTLPFQDGLPKGVKAVGWKVGTRLFLLEIKLRETIMAKLDPEIRGALEGAFKDRNKLATFTQEFLKALDSKGWLVKEFGKTKLEAKDALWVILAGKFDYKGVIIIDVPKEYATVLPSKDSLYEITIKGPLFAQSANQSVTSADLTDLGLFKKVDSSTPATPVVATAHGASTTQAPRPATQASHSKEPTIADLTDMGLFKRPGTAQPSVSSAPVAPAAQVASARLSGASLASSSKEITNAELTDLGLFKKTEPAKEPVSTPGSPGPSTSSKPLPTKVVPTKTL
jgi:hypothetical protein